MSVPGCKSEDDFAMCVCQAKHRVEMLEKSVDELKLQLEKGQGDASFSDRELNRQIVALDDVSDRWRSFSFITSCKPKNKKKPFNVVVRVHTVALLLNIFGNVPEQWPSISSSLG